MDASETRRAVDVFRRRRRRQRWWTASVVTALALVAIGWALFGETLECHYLVRREGYPMPRLSGMTVEHARAELPACLPLVVVDERANSDADPGTIVRQEPSFETTGSKVINRPRPIEVVVAGAGRT